MEIVTSTIPIKRAAELSGLPSSTLRYYEDIGLIGPIQRMPSGHRRYADEDIDRAIGIACLSAAGMSVREIRSYFENRERGDAAASDQLALIERQQKRLEDESRQLALRRRYVDAKADYWRAVVEGDSEAREVSRRQVTELATLIHSTPTDRTAENETNA